jgi:hypothetical protein
MAGVMTYNPNVDNLMTEIPSQEMNLNEELARAALERQQLGPTQVSVPTGLARPSEGSDKKTGPPTGLLRSPFNTPEKDVEESQMADFATPIEEIMPGPGQMMQDEMMGSPYVQAPPQHGASKSEDSPKSSRSSKNPFGLSDEHYQALLAGVAAVVAFSKPVQGKLGDMVPKFHGPSGEVSLTGLAVTALVAAIVFYMAKKYLVDGQ